MKLNTVLVLSSLVIAFAWTSQASIEIAKWTFDTSPPADLNNSTIISAITADSGANKASSSASGVHTSSATDWTTPTGNGSANSLSANTWASGDYFQFQTSLSGYENIKLSWEQTRSGTGPTSFKLAYSTDGTVFTDFMSYSVVENLASPGPGLWNMTTYVAGYSLNADLSAISALDNAAIVYFRLIDTIAPGGLNGTSRVDDFIISGDVINAAVPEPSTWAAGALLALPFGVHGVRYLRNRKRA